VHAANIRDKVQGTVINITVKSNPGHILAPTWDIVMGFKDRKITWAGYVTAYNKLIAKRRETRERELVDIARLAIDGEVYLVCFCTDENICHRTLARDIVRDVVVRLTAGDEGF
jgi:hypothetical protein